MLSNQQPQQQQQQQQNLVKLKYRVIYCSGEDAEYPVTELLDPTPNSRGWQSQKFCEFPQEIIVQFPNMVKLKQLQFLSHQSKIASKIELFTFVPSGSQAMISQIPLNEISFKRLGYLSLDSNERSGFQARELKSVYVDSSAVLLKLIFHKCHLNNFNIFNQIGLVALNCIGANVQPGQIPQELGSQPESHPSSSSSKTRAGMGSEFDMLEPEMLTKIKLLEQAKNKAVDNELFDDAKKMKQAIDKIKSIGGHISQLNERKRMATMNEDYDAAKVIKSEIERLKSAAYDPWIEDILQRMQPSFNKSQQHFAMGNTQSQFQQQPPYQQQQQQPPQFQMGRGMQPPQMATSLEDEVDRMNLVGGGGPSSGMARRQQFEQEDAMSPPSNIQKGNKVPSRKFTQDDEEQEQQLNKGPIDVDEQVLPTHKIGGNKKPQEYEKDEYEGEEDKEAEPLTGEKQKQAEPMIQTFGETYVRKVFSKVWQLREEGIGEIENMILNEGSVSNEAKAFVNGIGVVRYTVGDRMAQVAQKSMQFLSNLCKNVRPSLNPTLKGELQSYQDPIVQSLVDKLGDNLQKVRNSAEDALISVAGHPMFGVQTCLNVMTRPAPAATQKDTKKTMISNKHIIGKYSVLMKMLQSFDFSNEQCLQGVKFCLKGVQHQLQDVRNVAYKCMQELYRFMGNDIMKHLDDLRPAQLEQLQQLFSEIDGGQMAKQISKKNQPKETITTNINPGGQKNQKKGGVSQARQVQEEQDDDYGEERESIQYKAQSQVQPQNTKHQQKQQDNNGQQQACTFCGKNDEGFNQDTLDIHYWRECPMLVSCWECNQVIEIAGLDEHLLEECDNRDEYKLCSKCKSVFRIEEFNGHECIRPNPPGAVKCQLCKSSVHPANEQGWKRHIVDNGCPGNNRIPQ